MNLRPISTAVTATCAAALSLVVTGCNCTDATIGTGSGAMVVGSTTFPQMDSGMGAMQKRRTDDDPLECRADELVAVVALPLGADERGSVLSAAKLENSVNGRGLEDVQFSSFFGDARLDPGVFGAVEVDAISFGQDSLRVQYRSSASGVGDRWQLQAFPCDYSGGGPGGWAMIAFVDGKTRPAGLVRTIAWGPALEEVDLPAMFDGLRGVKSAPIGIPDFKTGADTGHEGSIYQFDVLREAGAGAIQGLDVTCWHVLSSIAERCEPGPRCFVADGFRVYFSVTPAAFDALAPFLDDATAASKSWRSGASIFVTTLRKGEGDEWAWDPVSLVYTPTKDANGRGLDPADDIDALAIDHVQGYAVVSLTANSPSMHIEVEDYSGDDAESEGSSLYAFELVPETPTASWTLDGRYYPTPLYSWDGSPLDRRLPGSGAMPVSFDDHNLPPIDPKGGCGVDPDPTDQCGS